MNKIQQLLAKTANAIAHQAKEELFEKEKEQTIALIKAAALTGEFHAHLPVSGYERWDDIKKWLEDCGYIVKYNAGAITADVIWDDLAIQTHLYLCTSPKPAKVTHSGAIKTIFRVWDKDYCDCICLNHHEHNQSDFNFCPNCGGRLYKIKEKETD